MKPAGSYGFTIWSTLVAVAAAGVMMASPVHALPIVTLEFHITTGAAGTVSFAGGAHPLVGTNLAVANVVALDAAGNQVGGMNACTNCFLNFTTGGFTGTGASSPTWDFAGGGTIALTGDFPAAGSTLFSGSFGTDGASVLWLSNSSKIVGGSFSDTKDPALLAFFGLTTAQWDGAFNIAVQAAGAPGDPFTSTRLYGSDISNSPAPNPEPGTWVLLGSGLIGLRRFMRRQRPA
jgi:hypothetical protein